MHINRYHHCNPLFFLVDHHAIHATDNESQVEGGHVNLIAVLGGSIGVLVGLVLLLLLVVLVMALIMRAQRSKGWSNVTY